MRYVAIVAGALSLLATPGAAQEQVGTVAEPGATSAAAPTEAGAQEENKRSIYYKKVQGWLWIEGFAGPSAYDPDQFGSLNLPGVPNAPRLKGPEYGFSALLGLGGFGIGAFYRQANYSQYKLMKLGVEIQGIFRFIPYVHPMVRANIGFAQTFAGNPYGSTVTNADSGGIVLTGGVGVRIPIIRWMSFAATVDWSFVGLSLRGDSSTGSFQSWILGQQFGATFALTFHFLGVRKN